MAGAPLVAIRATGVSPGNCNGPDGQIAGDQDYVRIATRTDGAAYLSGMNFHSAACVRYRIIQELLTRGRSGTSAAASLRRLQAEIDAMKS